ncbi:MAG: hypothetical protein GY808_01410 [Gammaproteobacteria bacterium]|nr:hypothetical protein [Gammaproteobacteria bacterium]
MNIEMSKYQRVVGFIILGTILLFGLVGISSAAKEESNSKERHEYNKHYDDGDSSGRKGNKYFKYKSKSVIKQDAIYEEECGSCHLAYPASLLPSESWHGIMTGLVNHFNESAELDKETTEHISNYLLQNALKRDKPSRYSKMLRNIPKKAPLRITQLPYFIHEHDEIPKQMIVDNPEVMSLSYCEKCHKDAAGGLFDEDLVVIPGFGRWDD